MRVCGSNSSTPVKQEGGRAVIVSVCRPLSQGALTYARTDVHFLLHIAAVMAQQLTALDCVQQVSKSSHTCNGQCVDVLASPACQSCCSDGEFLSL